MYWSNRWKKEAASKILLIVKEKEETVRFSEMIAEGKKQLATVSGNDKKERVSKIFRSDKEKIEIAGRFYEEDMRKITASTM